MVLVTFLTALRRIAAHRAVTAAAAVTILLASLTFTVLGTATAGVADAGTRQALASAPADSTTLVFSSGLSRNLDAADRGVDTAVRRLLRPYPARIVRAETFARIDLSTPNGETTAAGAVADGYAEHVRLLSGSLPTESGDLLVPARMARSNGLRAGGTVVVTQLVRGDPRHMTYRVSGVYEPSDSDPLFWAAVRPAADPKTGLPQPLMFAGPDILAVGQLGSDSQTFWYVQPDFSQATLAGAADVASRVLAVENGDVNQIAFRGVEPPVSGLSVTSALPRQVKLVKSAETIGVSGFLIVAMLLAVLAAFALSLTLRLVREHTSEESRLMQSRGAPSGLLVRVAAVEGVLLMLPALAVTPFAAGVLARGLRRVPGLRALPEPSSPVGVAQEVNILIAVFCVAIQAVAAWIGSRERPAQNRSRGARAAAFQRAGIDAGLTVLGVVGYLQLRHYRSPVSAGPGGLGIDPVLVVAPAVTAAAAAALALRLLPPAARLVDRRLDGSRSLAAALGGWQVSRRVARHAGTVLLLVLALAVGAMTVTAAAIRSRSAADRAAFQVGADVRVRASAIPEPYQSSAMAAVPGVAAATARAEMTAVAGTEQVSLVGVDPAAVPGVLAMRRDLAAGAPAAVFAPLTAPVPDGPPDDPDPAVPLPGRPASLDLDITVSAKAMPGESRAPRDGPAAFLVHAGLAVDLRDRQGVPLVLPVPLPSTLDTKAHLSIPLAVDGRMPDYPLSFEGFELVRPVAPTSLEVDLTVGLAPAVPTGTPWRLVDESAKPGEGSGNFVFDDCGGGAVKARIAVPVICGSEASAGQFTLRLASGHRPVSSDTPAPLRILVGSGSQAAAVPEVSAVATDAFLAATATSVGDKVSVTLDDDSRVRLAIVGRVAALPGGAAGEPAVAVDRALLSRELARLDAEPDWAVSWLLKLAPGGEPAAKAYLASHPDVGNGEFQTDVAATLRSGGFAGSESALLVIGAATAPMFAAVGFAVSAVTALRGRRREFAVLRAIGAWPRQLSAALWVEQVVLAAASVSAGVVIGVGAALVTVPLVTVDDAGAPVFPAVTRAAPWARGAEIAGGTAAVVVLVVMLAARTLSRVDLAHTLRAGDES